LDRTERELDVVVWGATGFTGALVAEYLFERYGAEGPLSWALGGRNVGRLEAVRDGLGPGAKALPLLVGDANDKASLHRLAERTRVVCTTVGPYALYGSELVAACVETGTDYCDLTGEIHWMQRMIDTWQDAAERSGARIVHTCGFDCIPSDLGTFFVQREMQRRHGVPSPHVKLRVAGFRGGASGGTIASMLAMMEAARRDPSVMRAMNEPYSINPRGERSGPDGPERMVPAHDPDFEQWTAPFVMAGVDTKVVRRTNALLGYAYGRDFRYDEAMLTGAGPAGAVKAAASTAAIAGGMAAMALGPVRRLVAGRLPSPGEGPSKETRASGYFDLRLHAAHPTDPARALRARVTGDRDPGYGSTSKMLGESAVCLAQDRLGAGGGFWTPAAALGDALLERLVERAGLTFSIEDGGADPVDPPR
jgi:short subunit dehydrogenase-like uncharacterized protein